MSPDPQPDKPKPSDDKPTPRKAFVAYAFQANSRTALAAGGAEVQGRVTWTLLSAFTPQTIAERMTAWDNLGYKMGLLLMKGQKVGSLAYTGLEGPAPLEPNTSFVADLGAALGAPDGYEWQAFSGKARRKYTFTQPNIIDFEVTLRITPAAQGTQLVPVASRHLQGTFTTAYMGGLWVIPGA